MSILDFIKIHILLPLFFFASFWYKQYNDAGGKKYHWTNSMMPKQAADQNGRERRPGKISMLNNLLICRKLLDR